MHSRFARCLDCNYPLGGIDAHRCPECGRPFQPWDAGSMNVSGREYGAFARFVLRPKLWPLNLATVAAGAWTLWLGRWPDGIVRYSKFTSGQVAGVWM
ncbi:MAG TPA: hypothetical protein VH475_19335, partial [Tepidisphaeraceae bacterium]